MLRSDSHSALPPITTYKGVPWLQEDQRQRATVEEPQAGLAQSSEEGYRRNEVELMDAVEVEGDR